MIDTRALGQELQELQRQIADRLRKGQESVTDAIRTWTHTAQDIRLQLPNLPRPETLTGKLPKPETLASKLPKVDALAARLPKPETLASKLPKAGELAARLPKPETLASKLPSAETVMAGAQDFAGQVVAGQRRLADQVLHAAGPFARQGAAMLGYAVSMRGHVPADAHPVAGTQAADSTSASGKQGTAHKRTAPRSTGQRTASQKSAAPKNSAQKGAGQKGAARKSAATGNSPSAKN